MIRLTFGVALAALLAACSPKANTTPASTTPATADKAEYRTALPVKEVMGHVIDHIVDQVWLNQGWIINFEGEHELFPTTEEGWNAVSNSAVALAEASNLLLLPGRPVDDDRRWIDATHMLYDAAMKTHEAAEARDKQAFFDGGGAIYEACVKCHQHYIIGE